MPYSAYYVAVGGWQDRPDLDTPITSAALNHMETGIATAQSTADTVAGQLSSYQPLSTVGSVVTS